jgi:hypothetical protein
MYMHKMYAFGFFSVQRRDHVNVLSLSLGNTKELPKTPFLHNILEPTMGVTFFNSGFKSDTTELFPSIVQVIAG